MPAELQAALTKKCTLGGRDRSILRHHARPKNATVLPLTGAECMSLLQADLHIASGLPVGLHDAGIQRKPQLRVRVCGHRPDLTDIGPGKSRDRQTQLPRADSRRKQSFRLVKFIYLCSTPRTRPLAQVRGTAIMANFSIFRTLTSHHDEFELTPWSSKLPLRQYIKIATDRPLGETAHGTDCWR